jgi:hypothetical protein
LPFGWDFAGPQKLGEFWEQMQMQSERLHVFLLIATRKIIKYEGLQVTPRRLERLCKFSRQSADLWVLDCQQITARHSRILLPVWSGKSW